MSADANIAWRQMLFVRSFPIIPIDRQPGKLRCEKSL
jgi:hypothetical protein